MKIALLVGLFISQVNSRAYCPTIQCDGVYTNAQDFTCYQHNAGPYTNMSLATSSCGYGQRCQINNSFVNIQPQSQNHDYSNVKLYGWCAYEEAFWKNFYPGTKCLTDFQCQNFNCSSWRCQGKPENSFCYDNSECDIGLFCKKIYLPNWTSLRVCSPLYNESQVCVNGTYTYECKNGYKCTSQYAGQTATCIKMHSLPAGNNSIDADLCETPKLSFGKCVDIEGMRSNGVTLDSPYQCSLQYDSNCYAIYSDQSVVFYEACQCTLSSNSVAYCPFPGKAAFKNIFLLYRDAALQSPNCHINVVKNSLFTQWELCTGNTTLVSAYKNAYRNMKEWAVSQDNQTYECYQRISQLTEYNQTVYTTFTKTSAKTLFVMVGYLCTMSLILIL